jgi:hypothetical protein
MTGGNISGYSEAAIRRTLAGLREYFQQCIAKGYLAESAFLTDVMANVRRDCAELKAAQALEAEEAAVAAGLEAVRGDFSASDQEWSHRLAELDVEPELGVTALSLRQEDARAALERKWNSEKTTRSCRSRLRLRCRCVMVSRCSWRLE